MLDRIRVLSDVFAIEVCAYAIMSNHYHLVLYVNEEEIKNCSALEICARWNAFYSLPIIVERWMNNPQSSETNTKLALEFIEEWRSRLMSISWFMRGLNEHIARKSNKEDNCKGRFWEGRFKSQALLDQKALLTCMAYVDLNPIRAKMASTIKTSEFTSAYERICVTPSNVLLESNQAVNELYCFHKPLVKFSEDTDWNEQSGIDYSFKDYLELLDWTGRILRDDKRGAISSEYPLLLSNIGIDISTWTKLALNFGKDFHCAVGSLAELESFARNTGKAWIAGKRRLQNIF
jgi:REP element-mobilizing transposase RayT